MKGDHFSARWSTWLRAPRPGRYKRIFNYDDSVRATLDRKPVVDGWKGGRHQAEAFVEFEDKPLPLVVEYAEESAGAYLSLHWEQEGGFKEQIIPPEAFFTDRAVATRAGGDAITPDREETAGGAGSHRCGLTPPAVALRSARVTNLSPSPGTPGEGASLPEVQKKTPSPTLPRSTGRGSRGRAGAGSGRCLRRERE